MRPRMVSTVCLALLICLPGAALAQFPGMPGMGMPGMGMPGMDMGMGMPGMGMPGMGMDMGMGMGQMAAPAIPKWVSPLVPLCWSVGRSQYPGIAVLYATQGQRADLEALINQVSGDIEGRFWIKFVDVTADSDPPSFIREVLDPEFRRAKGAAPGAAQAGMDMGMGQPGMGMGMGDMGGMGMGMDMGMGAQPTQTDKELLVAAQKACPAIVVFGKDLFSDWKPPAAGAAPGAQQQPGMGAPGMGMGEMGGMGMGMGMDMGMGMGAPGAAGAQATMWSRMDHNFMVYWSFVGRKEMPSPEILRFVLGAVGDPDRGINRWALRLKLNREDVPTTLELASSYVRALEQGREFLGGLNLAEDPTRGRIVQQNQYVADYLLARAETLRGGRTQVATIRARQAALAPSFRYEAPTRLVPLLAEHFPGVIAYYRTMDQRRRIETLLNAEPVAGGLRAGSYWCKLVDATDEDLAGEEDPVTRLRHEVGVDAKEAPALVLVGQDLFAEDVITLAAVGAPGGQMGMDMGMGMEMGGMPGMGMGMTGAAPAAAADEKPTDWLRGGGAGAAAGAGMGMGMEMGGAPGGMGAMPGMGMGGMEMGMGGMDTGMGGMGAQAGLGLGEINWNDYDYRMPERLARLMVHWSFVGDREMRAVTPQILGFALTAVGDPRGGIDARARALKPRKEEARPTLELGRAYAGALEEGRKLLGQVPGIAANSDLARLVQQNQYMADYMLARAATLRGGGALAREIRAEQEKLVPSFRHSSPNVLTPLLSEQFPGLVGFYRNPAERRRLEAVLDAPAVQQAMSRGSYWCKLIELTDPEGAQDKDLFAMLRSPEVEAELDKRFPALVLCGQDVFLRKELEEEVVVLAAGAATAPGAGMGMGMEMGGEMGMPGMGMGMPGAGPGAMPGMGAAPTGAGTMEKPTDWLPDGGFPPTGADVTAQAQVGMGMGGGMPGEMPGMGGMPGMEMGMGAAATVAPGAINLAGYDYRHPNRLARLMQYWLFAGEHGRDAVPAAARPDVLVDKLNRAKAVDDVSRALKQVPDRDDVRLLIDTGKAYLELERHYLSDYFLGRAVKYIEVAEFELRRAGRDIEADTWRDEDALDAHSERASGARAGLDTLRAEVRDLRAQLLPLFFNEKPTNQIPILLTEYPGLVIYYEGDAPGRVSRRDTPPTPRATDPSRQRDLLERIMAQPAMRELIRDKYWVKWVRVREGLSMWDEGIDAKPPFLQELPAIVLVSGDMFYYRSDPRPHMVGWQVTGGNGMDEADVDLEYEGEDTAPAAAQPTMQAGATPGMDLGMGAMLGGFQAGIQQYANAMWDAMGETPPQAAGMGMDMGMPGAGAAPAGTGDDPAAWLWAAPPVGAGPAQQMGTGGEMGGMPGMEMGGMGMPGAGGMGMPGAGMGMPTTAQARSADEEPIPGGVIRGESARHGLFCQWADYEHVNQMGRRQGYSMAHLGFVGRNNLPSPPAPPAVSDGVPEARRADARRALEDLRFAAWMGDGARSVDALRRFMTAVGQDPAARVDIPAASTERVRRALLDMGWDADAAATAQAAELLAKSEVLVQQAVRGALSGREEAARSAVALLEAASANSVWSPALHGEAARLVGENQAQRLLYPLRVQRWVRRDMAWNVAEWQRQLATVWDINNVGAAAHTEAIVARRKGGDPPQAHNALALARLYVALPGPHMAEYMLARADYLLEEGWEPIPDAVRASAQRASEQQKRGPAYSGGDELPELYNFVRDMPDTGPYAEAWLALMTAMRREGTLPLPAAAQYVSTTLTAGGDAPAGTETTLGRDVPAYFQAPPERLTVEQLQQVRAGMIRAVGRSLPSDHARAAWGRLFHVELELRDRRNISGMDASWREIMSLWRNRQAQAAPYLEVVLKACADSVREEIKALRAMNLVDMELQWTAAREPVPQVRQSVDQVPALVEFLKRRPNGQAAPHARYLMAQVLEGTAQTAAAREQLDVLQAMDAPPAWWRWGLVRWERLQRM